MSAGVVAVKEVASGVPKEEWDYERLLPGDIIERVTWVSGKMGVAAPFTDGKTGLETVLRQMLRVSDEPVFVWVRRSDGAVEELCARVLSTDLVISRKHYTLCSFQDDRHIVHLVHTTEDECLRWQEATMKIVENFKGKLIKDPDITKKRLTRKGIMNLSHSENILQGYPWTEKMKSHLPVVGSSMLFSILFMPFTQPFPKRLTTKGVEDTTARAMAWFCSAQTAGVPIIFVNIQTEHIFKESLNDKKYLFDSTKNEYMQHLTTGERFKVACPSIPIIDVTRAVRLWYMPSTTEVPIDLVLEDGEEHFGLSITRNEEGFCHVIEVKINSPGERAGVKGLWELAIQNDKLLVISRVGEETVVPWLVSSDGIIHCHGIHAICEQLRLRQAKQRCAQIHLLIWESFSKTENALPTTNKSSNGNNSKSGQGIDMIHLTSSTSTPEAMNFGSHLAKRRTMSWSETTSIDTFSEM